MSHNSHFPPKFRSCSNPIKESKGQNLKKEGGAVTEIIETKRNTKCTTKNEPNRNRV
jgi:hypothetical protein